MDRLDDLPGAGLYISMPLVVLLAHLLPQVHIFIEPLQASQEEGNLIISPQNLCHLEVTLGKTGTKEISIDDFP